MMTYNFIVNIEAATKAVEQYLGRSLTWQQLPDGRYLTQLEPMDHWRAAKHSGIEGIDPYGNPDPDND